jgi:hypothetical protein
MTTPEHSTQIDFAKLGVERNEFYTIQGALHDPNHKFRTIPGIEKDTGLPRELVERVLNESGIARQSVFRDRVHRERCYAPIDQKKTLREKLAEAQYILAR